MFLFGPVMRTLELPNSEKSVTDNTQCLKLENAAADICIKTRFDVCAACYHKAVLTLSPRVKL